MELYTVLTADVIGSRRQETVVAAKKTGLQELTDASLVTPFTFSRGDEIQAVVAGVLSSPAILRKLRYYCLPLQLRIGIGLGRITSGLGANSSWEMNGPAFHRARQALDEVKQHRHWRTRLVSGDPGLDQTVNTLFNLYDVIQSRWTFPQWEGVMLYEATGSYQEAGQRLGIAFQNVEKRCRAARWWAIREAEATFPMILSQYTDFNLVLGE
ncbi:MAG: hypothetical protein GX770_03070 [Firmicutes bacterium]|nr:hypothetical protein [Bacillota bacterium]